MTLQPVLEIGGTHVTAAVVEGGVWEVRRQRRFPLDSHAPATVILDTLANAARSVYEGTAAHWGVAIPGPFDNTIGVGSFTGVGKFESLAGLHLATELASRMPEVADAFVFVNDADAFAMGEWILLDPAVDRAVFLTLGTGVGSSFLDQGKPAAGAAGIPPHGHVHHLEWNGLPIEETVSRRALIRGFESVTGIRLDVHEIASRAREGDRPSKAVFDRAFTALGECIAPSVTTFDADVIIVGGSIASSWELVHNPLGRGLDAGGLNAADRFLWRARSPHVSPLVGAARAARLLQAVHPE
ncbi:ROK family protein [Agromyces sp. S2-1-8]|uniref:ROK family protein n=1 Tax=Agromyces sp. S2-1-8 TaxID=2897180 RepID=UPI001E6280C8|nr:ROK family protein [Agromyces sp. S2-1-8]MCD5344894.1 ROK family protein [Agromyces sp. S2-1-8]